MFQPQSSMVMDCCMHARLPAVTTPVPSPLHLLHQHQMFLEITGKHKKMKCVYCRWKTSIVLFSFQVKVLLFSLNFCQKCYGIPFHHLERLSLTLAKLCQHFILLPSNYDVLSNRRGGISWTSWSGWHPWSTRSSWIWILSSWILDYSTQPVNGGATLSFGNFCHLRWVFTALCARQREGTRARFR